MEGDVFLVKYEGDLGMGHEYVDVSAPPTAVIEDLIKSAYERRALESILEDDKKWDADMERCRKRDTIGYEIVTDMK